MKYVSFLVFLFLILTSCSSTRITESEVGSGWANNSVNTVIFRENAVTTHENTQFTAYYDDDRNLVLAKRDLNDEEWTIYQTKYKGNAEDAHNAINLAVDGDGFLHVSWDHHDTPLQYAMGKEPFGLELTSEKKMTGKQENKLSYPQFYNLPNGDLIFFYRSGQSGQGTMVVNRYNNTTDQWEQLHQNLLDGEKERNAYWQAFVDESGTIHLSWVWRETWDASTNHDLAYAKSRDGGITWEKSNGTAYNLPITAETAEYAWRIPQKSSLINQTAMTVDDEGNPYIGSYWNENGTTQFHVVYLKNGQWLKESTDFRNSIFHLGGGGTKKIPISRPEILVDSGDNAVIAYLLFRDEERGNRISLAYKNLELPEATPWKIKEITEKGVGQWEPNYDKQLFKKEEKLHIFVQKVTQIDGEGVADQAATPVKILEVNKLPKK